VDLANLEEEPNPVADEEIGLLHEYQEHDNIFNLNEELLFDEKKEQLEADQKPEVEK
jgi:hypothetical protein